MKIKKKHILIVLLILLLTFILTLSIALPLHFKSKVSDKFNPETQTKSPVFLKAVYETLDSSTDFEKEIKLGDFKVGTELKITHPEITAKLKDLVSENHEKTRFSKIYTKFKGTVWHQKAIFFTLL